MTADRTYRDTCASPESQGLPRPSTLRPPKGSISRRTGRTHMRSSHQQPLARMVPLEVAPQSGSQNLVVLLANPRMVVVVGGRLYVPAVSRTTFALRQ